MIRFAKATGLLLLFAAMVALASPVFRSLADPQPPTPAVGQAAAKATATGLKEFTYAQLQMAMPIHLTVWCESEAIAEEGCKLAFARVADLVKVFSDYDSNSEVNQFLNSEVGVPAPVSRELFEVLAFSKRLCEETDGAFDPTLGPLVRLWRQARKTGELPNGELLEAAKSRTGFGNLILDAENQTATLLANELRLDLGGIAKGYIGDQIIELLRTQDIPIAKYQAGGDVVLGAGPPNLSGWQIQVLGRGGKPKELRLQHCGVSTSGDLNQFVEVDGVRYSHVVDPRSGNGVSSGRLVVVVAPCGMQSDAIATAGCVLLEREFQDLVGRYDDTSAWVQF